MRAKWSFLIALAIILTACGPVTPVPTPTPAPVNSWPGMKPGWSAFWAPPSFISNPLYDPSGYIWALNNRSAYRWEIASGKMELMTSANGLPAWITTLTAFKSKIWVATQDGSVASFDGKQWKLEKLSKEPLRSFSSTPERLWVYGNNRAFFYENGVWNEFKFVTPSTYGLVQLVQAKDDVLWCNFGGEVWKFVGEKWQRQENAGFPRSIFALPDGTVYFWLDTLILKFDGQTYQPVMFPDNSYTYFPKQIFQTGSGELWTLIRLGGKDRTFIIHSDSTIQETSYIPLPKPENPDAPRFQITGWMPEGLILSSTNQIGLYKNGNLKIVSTLMASDELGSIIRDYNLIGFSPDGALWLSQRRNYKILARYDGQTLEQPFGEFTEDLDVRDAKIDAQGELWSFNYRGELYRFKIGNRPIKYKLYFSIFSLAFAPDGSIWLLGDDGYLAHLQRQDLVEDKVITPEFVRIGEGVTTKTVKSIDIKTDPAGNVWIYADEEGFYRYNGRNWQFYKLPAGAEALTFDINSKGEIWVEANSHLYKQDGKSWIDYQHDCLCPSSLTVAPDDAVWFINGCLGVYRFDEKNWIHYTREKEMSGAVPRKIYSAPDGAMWFISDEAWVRYQP
jgi:streptogramin lyase